jgi:endonuclease-3
LGPSTNTDSNGHENFYSVEELILLLEKQYGPFRWVQRYEPITELIYTILSQHTSDLNSERAGNILLNRFGSWEAVTEAPLTMIEETIRPAGLSKQKAPRIKGALQTILGLRGALNLDFLAGLPLEEAKAWLRQLPGVGPKTTAIVLCFAFGMPAMPVDTHIHRVTKRLGLISSKVSADQAHDLLEPMVPPNKIFSFHMGLIMHGRATCKALRPRCRDCVLRIKCPSKMFN